jgi:hypothetical protein
MKKLLFMLVALLHVCSVFASTEELSDRDSFTKQKMMLDKEIAEKSVVLEQLNAEKIEAPASVKKYYSEYKEELEELSKEAAKNSLLNISERSSAITQKYNFFSEAFYQ